MSKPVIWVCKRGPSPPGPQTAIKVGAFVFPKKVEVGVGQNFHKPAILNLYIHTCNTCMY